MRKRLMRTSVTLLAAAFCLAFAAPAAAGESGQPKEGGVYYEEPSNLCEELGGSPECPPGGRPVDPAKAREMKEDTSEAPEVIYEPPPEGRVPDKGDASEPEAYRQLESDCEKSGWGGAPTCD